MSRCLLSESSTQVPQAGEEVFKGQLRGKLALLLLQQGQKQVWILR